MIAGAYIATMSHAITMTGNVLKKQKLAKNVAADMYHNTTKYKNAAMFHNTTQKHAANKYQSTMMLKSAYPAKNGFVKRNANMFHVTTTNTFVVMQTAKFLAQQNNLSRLL
jgi:hypothetical protein